MEGVSCQNDIAVVTVSFSSGRPSYMRRVHRYGDNDWRPEPLPWEPFDIPDRERDLAEQLLGKRFDGSITVTAATGSRQTSPGGGDLYALELVLTVAPDIEGPLTHRSLRNFVKWYMESSGIRVNLGVQTVQE